MKPISSFTIFTTGLVISIIITMLTSYHLDGVEFFNQTLPITLLAIASYFSHKSDQMLINLHQGHNKELNRLLTECYFKQNQLRAKLSEERCKQLK